MRGYDRERQRFSDFVLIHIVEAQEIDGDVGESELLPADEQWARMVGMELVPHPGIKQPKAIKADYVPSLEKVRLPPKRPFKTEYDYYSTAHHEICHSSMAPHRLNRAEAYAKKWGDSAYALEELTAEIGAAILSSETGVARSPELAAAHLEDHAKYLRNWINAIQSDPMAIFTAAKNAEKISEYVLGLERQMTALAPHKAWIEDYDRADTACNAVKP